MRLRDIMRFDLNAEILADRFNLMGDEAAFVPDRTTARLSFSRFAGDRRTRAFFECRAKMIRLRFLVPVQPARSTINPELRPGFNCQSCGQTKTAKGRGVALVGQEFVSAILPLRRRSTHAAAFGFQLLPIAAAKRLGATPSTSFALPRPRSPATFATASPTPILPLPALRST